MTKQGNPASYKRYQKGARIEFIEQNLRAWVAARLIAAERDRNTVLFVDTSTFAIAVWGDDAPTLLFPWKERLVADTALLREVLYIGNPIDALDEDAYDEWVGIHRDHTKIFPRGADRG